MRLAWTLLIALLATPAAAEDATAPSPHLWSAALPGCSAEDARIVGPEEASSVDWNEPGVRVFCVEPGNYTGLGSIHLTRAGSVASPRWIRYFDPSTPDRAIHPYGRAPGQRARFAGFVVAHSADAWVLHGLTIEVSSPRGGVAWFGDDGVFDFGDVFSSAPSRRTLRPGILVGGAGDRTDGTDRVTIQRSTVHDLVAERNGRVGIAVRASDHDHVNQDDIRVLDNEVWNVSDGFQAVCCTGRRSHDGNHTPGALPGLLVEGNDFYMTDAWRAPCDWRPGAGLGEGSCGCTENAVDIKVGGLPGRPARISSNRMHHVRPSTDRDGGPACGNARSDGTLLVLHQHASDILLTGNVLWKGTKGIMTSGSTRRVTAEGNLIAQTDVPHPGGRTAMPVSWSGDEMVLEGNVFVSEGAEAWGALSRESRVNRQRVRCNVIVGDAPSFPKRPGRGVRADQNAFYGKGGLAPFGEGCVLGDEEDAQMADRCFRWKRWTGPERTCIAHGLPTGRSPRHPLCDEAGTSGAPKGQPDGGAPPARGPS